MSTSETAERGGCTDGTVVLTGKSQRQLAAACGHAEMLMGCNDEKIAAEHLRQLLRSLMILRREL